jgi:arylformamidase
VRPHALYRGFTTQEELDAEYDIARSVADPQRHLDTFAAESARAREELECRLDVPYGPTRPERLDLFPAGPGAPVLVFLHGGYWRARSARDFSFVARGPVAAGVSVAVVEYALCPEVTIEEIVRQSRAAVAWLHEHVSELGADPERLHVAGHSAGGQLVGMLLATDWERDYRVPREVIAGACAISGLFDLAPLRHSFLQPALQLTEGQVRRASPINRLPGSAPPLLVTYGGRESAELRRQSEDFLEAWRGRGLSGERLDQPEANHYTAVEGFVDPESALCRAVLRQIGGQVGVV